MNTSEKHNFDLWNKQKKKINNQKTKHYFHEQEIWLLSLGKNIGIELNGKGESFMRPVYIYKKFNRQQCVVIPLTSKGKNTSFYYLLPDISFLHQKSFLSFSQIKIIDQKRLVRKLGKLSDTQALHIKKSAQAVLEPQSPNGHNVH